MASSFTDLLRLEDMANGENDNTWGDVTDDNIDKIEQAIAGRVGLTAAASDITLTTNNGGDGTSEQAVNLFLDITGSQTANLDIIVPNVSKMYIIRNAAVQAVSETIGIKTSAGSALNVPNGDTLVVWCDGSNNLREIQADVSGTVSQATNADQLGSIVAANYAQKAVKNTWTAPQTVLGLHRSLTVDAYQADVNTDEIIIIDQSEIGASDITMSNPTNTPVDSQTLTYQIEQHGSTPVSVIWGSEFVFAGGVDLDLTQTIDRVDSFSFMYSLNLDRWIMLGATQDIPRT